MRPARCAPRCALSSARGPGARSSSLTTACELGNPLLIMFGGCLISSIGHAMLTCRNIHDEAMIGLTATETARGLAEYDSSQFLMIVDVRGGNGAFLTTLLS